MTKPSAADELRPVLLSVPEALELHVRGRTDATVRAAQVRAARTVRTG